MLPRDEGRPGRRAGVRWIADHELWVLALLLPLLILPNPLSPWVVVILPALWLLRWAARGTITRRTSLDLPILLLLLLVPLGFWASPDPALSLPALYLPLAGVALYSGLVNWIAPAKREPNPPAPLPTREGGVSPPRVGPVPSGAEGEGPGEGSAPARLTRAAGLLVAGGALLALASPLLVPTWGKVGLNRPLLPEAFAALLPYLPDTIQTNTLGAVMAMLICLTAAVLLGLRWAPPSRSSRSRLAAAGGLAAALALMGVVSLLAWSRGALVALVPALLLVLVLTDWRFLGLVPPLALAGAGLVAWLGPQRLLDQLLSTGPAYYGAAATRLEIWDRALRLLADVPYTGAGLGMFGQVVPARYAYVLCAAYPTPIAHAHNIFLQAGADFGLLGIVALAWLLAAAFVSLARTLRVQPGGWQRPIAVGLAGALAAFTLHGLVDCAAWTLKPEIVFWALLGLTGGLEAANPRPPLWSLATRHRRAAWAAIGLLALATVAVAGLALPAGVSLGYANLGNRTLNRAYLAPTETAEVAAAASGDLQPAIADLRRAVDWWGDNQAARLALGLAYDRAGQGAAALEAWRAIPEQAAAWLVTEGDSRFVRHEYEAAQDRYLLAVALDPASGSAQFGLGEVYRVWGARQQALAAYERAKTLASFQPGGRADVAACYFGIGKVYAQDEDWPAAVWQLKAGLNLRPDEDAHRTLGAIYHQDLKDLAQAEFCFKQAIALRPDRPYAYEELGYVYLDGKRPEEARAQFEMAVALAPDQAEMHVGLGQACAALGLFDQAIREYRLATHLSPNDPWLYIQLGDVYHDLGRIAEARAAYQQALVVDPGNGAAQRRLEALPH